jgi:Protein of unknown function (DUF1190)
LFRINAKSKNRWVGALRDVSEVALRDYSNAARRGCAFAITKSRYLMAAAAIVLTIQPDIAGARHWRQKVQPKPAASQTIVFPDEHECSTKSALAAPECHNAFVNSRAEYEEKAPRFDGKDACARFFGAANCAMRIGAGGPNSISFVPSYKGFTLVAGKNGVETMVLPALAATNAPVAFTPRPVSRLDTDQDAALGARAQAAWQAAHAPVARGPGGAMSYREAPKDATPDLFDDNGGAAQSGPAATYPLSPAMLERLHEEMRKYGTPPK